MKGCGSEREEISTEGCVNWSYLQIVSERALNSCCWRRRNEVMNREMPWNEASDSVQFCHTLAVTLSHSFHLSGSQFLFL